MCSCVSVREESVDYFHLVNASINDRCTFELWTQLGQRMSYWWLSELIRKLRMRNVKFISILKVCITWIYYDWVPLGLHQQCVGSIPSVLTPLLCIQNSKKGLRLVVPTPSKNYVISMNVFVSLLRPRNQPLNLEKTQILDEQDCSGTSDHDER